jgi:hypothetical protein
MIWDHNEIHSSNRRFGVKLMTDQSKAPDRAVLDSAQAFWADDTEENLTETELEGVLAFFAESENAQDPELRLSLKMQFQEFFDMVSRESSLPPNGKLKKPQKPSTIIQNEMKRLLEACEVFDKQLAGLNPVTQTWLDQHFEEHRITGAEHRPYQLRDLQTSVYRTIDLLVHAAREAEGIASRGPKNTALDFMIENLAICWEKSHGSIPITDKGRGRRSEPFLDLCQMMARIAHERLKVNGGGLKSLKLDGIVDKVLTKQRSQSTPK